MAETQVKVKEEEKKQDVKKVEAEEKFVKTLQQIRDVIKSSGTKHDFKENNIQSGTSFFGPERIRLLKVVKTRSGFTIEFNVEVPKVDGLKVLTPEQAKAKHMGTCRWIYSGSDEKVIKQLVTEAVKNFEPVAKMSRKADNKKEEQKKGTAEAKAEQKREVEKPSKVKNYTLPKEELDKIKTKPEQGAVKEEQKQKTEAKNNIKDFFKVPDKPSVKK